MSIEENKTENIPEDSAVEENVKEGEKASEDEKVNVEEDSKVELEIEESEPEEEPLEEEAAAQEAAKTESKRALDDAIGGWEPRTELGKKVKSGEIKTFAEIREQGLKVMEPEIAEVLLADIESDLLLIGQAKGKFGGGQRRIFKQTQKKTKEGNKPSFATFAVVGNKNGYVGVGYGKSKETVPAREKSMRNAKLNIMQIRRGCGSWECECKQPHSIPFEVSGSCGSVRLKLMPAPKGTGLCVEPECQKVLKLAGITDVWSRTLGQTKTKTNLIKACVDALHSLNKMKISQRDRERLGIVEGSMRKEEK
ncbi:MAG: 30S ribosomal protein S5 [Nanoarchaeota archaeon]|nr:30S ribosomal protein S5 [Nanoarchaeota archaeon]